MARITLPSTKRSRALKIPLFILVWIPIVMILFGLTASYITTAKGVQNQLESDLLSQRDTNQNADSSSIPEILSQDARYDERYSKQSTAPACTFSDLDSAFRKKPIPPTNDGECWSLKDRVIRIQKTDILFKDKKHLGSGAGARVMEVTLQLAPQRYCRAAYKRQVHARYQMGGEYTASLATYAQYGRTPEPGLVTTWALVQDRENPLKLENSERGSLHVFRDSSIIGIIMPLAKMTLVEDWIKEKKLLDARSLARIMLPAARALQLLSEMGLETQDIHPGNIGVTKADGVERGVIFDSTHMSVKPNHTCASSICRYCPETDFPVAGERGSKYHAGWDASRTDAIRFREIVVELLKMDDPQSDLLKSALEKSTTAREVVEALKRANESQ